MRGTTAAGILVGAGLATFTALAISAPARVGLERRPDHVQLDAEGDGTPVEAPVRLADRLFLIRGGGGVSTVFVTSKGVVLVDPKYESSWTAVERAVRTVTDQPITHVVVTHFHADHAESVLRLPATARLYAHENAIERLIFDRVLPDDAVIAGRAVPYQQDLTLFDGADTVRLHWPGPAHTNGDTFVYFEQARALQMGDVFPDKVFPIVHIEGGGDGRRFPTVVRDVLAALPDATHVITGHGPVMNRRELADYGDFMQRALDYVQTEMGMFRDKVAIFQGYRLPDRFADYDRTRQFNTLDEIDRCLRPRWQRVF